MRRIIYFWMRVVLRDRGTAEAVRYIVFAYGDCRTARLCVVGCAPESPNQRAPLPSNPTGEAGPPRSPDPQRTITPPPSPARPAPHIPSVSPRAPDCLVSPACPPRESGACWSPGLLQPPTFVRPGTVVAPPPRL